jgi:hypothetical protein
MATSPMTAYRAADDAKAHFRLGAVTSVPQVMVTTLDADMHDGLRAFRGIHLGLLLSTPFWVGVYATVSYFLG